jgi:hypothetical protein
MTMPNKPGPPMNSLKAKLQKWLGIDVLKESSMADFKLINDLRKSIAYCENCGEPVKLNEKWEWVGVKHISHSKCLGVCQ